MKSLNQKPNPDAYKRWKNTKQIKINLVTQGYEIVEERGDGCMFYNKKHKLCVITSFFNDVNNNLWQHISVSHQKCLPLYSELMDVKSTFVGDDRVVYQVHVPFEEHVNLMEYCLHLWHPIGHRPIPAFHGNIIHEGEAQKSI